MKEINSNQQVNALQGQTCCRCWGQCSHTGPYMYYTRHTVERNQQASQQNPSNCCPNCGHKL